MNDHLIHNWNDRVQPSDSVYFLGDFSFGNPEETGEILRQLRGHKHLVTGNHDRRGRAEKTDWDFYFNSRQDYMRLKYEGKKFVLCHFPFESWERGYVHLHGHSHGELRTLKGRHDVGVDMKGNYYSPISFQEAFDLAQSYDKLPPYQEVSVKK
jgi:calcineurin-like phosphoesterase family protein